MKNWKETVTSGYKLISLKVKGDNAFMEQELKSVW